MIITIQEAAKRVGVTSSAIRYYDKNGLLPFVERDKYNHRIFHENDLIWIELIKALRETDMPIEMIQKYINLTVQGRSSLEERFNLMTEYQRQLEIKVTQDQAHCITINRWINHFIKVMNNENLDKFPDNVDKHFPEEVTKSILDSK
mgnify:FL=1